MSHVSGNRKGGAWLTKCRNYFNKRRNAFNEFLLRLFPHDKEAVALLNEMSEVCIFRQVHLYLITRLKLIIMIIIIFMTEKAKQDRACNNIQKIKTSRGKKRIIVNKETPVGFEYNERRQ
jgi:hypothetical protein